MQKLPGEAANPTPRIGAPKARTATPKPSHARSCGATAATSKHAVPRRNSAARMRGTSCFGCPDLAEVDGSVFTGRVRWMQCDTWPLTWEDPRCSGPLLSRP